MTENIKDALEYAADLKSGQTVIYYEEGKTWYDANKASLAELDKQRYATTLTVHTLTGLIGYLKQRFDESLGEKLLVHVASPTEVNVYSELNDDRRRESAIVATTELDRYPYGRFLDSEKFIIDILSLSQRDENSEAIRKCASAIRIEGGGDLTDDGVSQTVTVKQGAATKGQAEVPSPVELRPYRTFLEVEQPQSPFVFRIDKNGFCALFEADGGMWKNHAINNVAEFMEDAFKEEIESGFITIIG